MKCIICCDYASNQHEKYFVIPGHIIVPNCYRLCETHKNETLEFHNLYLPDGTRKKVIDYLFDHVKAHDFKNVRERIYEDEPK